MKKGNEVDSWWTETVTKVTEKKRKVKMECIDQIELTVQIF